MGGELKSTGIFSRKLILGTTIGGAIVFMFVGVILWGGFNTAMEATNTLEFCISCHEMEDTVYQEYKQTVHYANRSGVRAVCSDCHVPDPWVHKVVRKIKASNELFHKVVGSVDTPEKFEVKRLELAQRVWAAMKATDSRECRNCHHFESMDANVQKPRAQKQHENAMQSGQTCIDCHKGIAHKKVHHLLADKELEILERPDPSRALPDAKLMRLSGKVENGAAAAQDASAGEPAEAAPIPVAAPAVVTETAAVPVNAAAGADAGVDWSKAPKRETGLFYPGQASMEWVLNGRDHSGVRAFKAGDRCFDCHDQEVKDIGQKIVTGEKLEPTPIPGKRGSIPVTVQAAHDGEYLYMRFQWPDSKHVPVPTVAGGKMDPDNAMKLAVMLATNEVEYADRAGCWGTCHHDLRTMPDSPSGGLNGNPAAQALDLSVGVTKYIQESRSAIEIKGGDGQPRGGWDKLKDAAVIQAELGTGHFMDLMRYKSGKGESENGHVLEQRHMNGGQGMTFVGKLKDGTWTVTMKRKLKSDKPGDLSLALDKIYNIGFAIHDDYSNARYHHVSLGYKLGFDNAEAEINAVKQ